MPHIRVLFFGLAVAFPFTASANPSADEALIERFSSIALPIAKGAVLEDDKGCFWWVRNGEKSPEVVALVGDQPGKQLCGSRRPSLIEPRSEAQEHK
jgi:hypothetical protein